MRFADTVAPLCFLDPEKHGTLYSIIFGEGVMNDVVSILLVSAAASVPGSHLSYGSLFWRLGYFFVFSTLLGAAFGALISYLSRLPAFLKKSRKGRETELVILLFFANYLVYILAELAEVSSVLAIFVSGVFCGRHWGGTSRVVFVRTRLRVGPALLGDSKCELERGNGVRRKKPFRVRTNLSGCAPSH